MHIFEVTAKDQNPLTVFAPSYERAVGIYMLHWVTNHRADLPDIEVKRRNTQWPGLDTALLAEALDRGMSGIGRLDDRGGWTIVPADHRIDGEA